MRRALLLAVVAAVLLAATPADAVHKTGEQFRVQLEVDGDATVTVEDRYNLSNTTQREQFEAVQGNETRQRQLREAFVERLEHGLQLARQNASRQMAIRHVRVNVTEADGTGYVRVSALWSNMAVVSPEGGYVELREPFRSGFTVNRTLVVFGPDGFTRAATHPSPARALKNSAWWAEGQSLSGFLARFSGAVPTEAPQQSPTATVAPITGAGLSALATAVAVAAIPALAVALLFGREMR